MEEALEPHAAFSKAQRQLGRRLLPARIFVRGGGLVQSKHRAASRPVRRAGGRRRFIFSLRAVGEGHVSSLTFRSGTHHGRWKRDSRSDRPSGLRARGVEAGRPGPDGDDVEVAFRRRRGHQRACDFPDHRGAIERHRGCALRRVRGRRAETFYATYTAYSGRAIRSELIETTDFDLSGCRRLAGAAAKNKGMALFPRKIDGNYAMIARQDNENLYLIYSDDLYSWDGGHCHPSSPSFPGSSSRSAIAARRSSSTRDGCC